MLVLTSLSHLFSFGLRRGPGDRDVTCPWCLLWEFVVFSAVWPGFAFQAFQLLSYSFSPSLAFGGRKRDFCGGGVSESNPTKDRPWSFRLGGHLDVLKANGEDVLDFVSGLLLKRLFFQFSGGIFPGKRPKKTKKRTCLLLSIEKIKRNQNHLSFILCPHLPNYPKRSLLLKTWNLLLKKKNSPRWLVLLVLQGAQLDCGFEREQQMSNMPKVFRQDKRTAATWQKRWATRSGWNLVFVLYYLTGFSIIFACFSRTFACFYYFTGFSICFNIVLHSGFFVPWKPKVCHTWEAF